MERWQVRYDRATAWRGRWLRLANLRTGSKRGSYALQRYSVADARVQLLTAEERIRIARGNCRALMSGIRGGGLRGRRVDVRV